MTCRAKLGVHVDAGSTFGSEVECLALSDGGTFVTLDLVVDISTVVTFFLRDMDQLNALVDAIKAASETAQVAKA